MTPTMERDSLVARLLEHADTQIEDNNRYIQKADELMREAAAALSRPEQVVADERLQQRMLKQVAEWQNEEPREDWWQYQRDFEKAALCLTTAPRPEQVKPVATGPYVDRLIRIFRDRTDDDTSAVVLLDYAKACLESASCLALSPATAEDQAASKEGA